jgi:hypothetical protein
MRIKTNMDVPITAMAAAVDPLGFYYDEAGLAWSSDCSCCGLDTCAFGPVSGDAQRNLVNTLTVIL